MIAYADPALEAQHRTIDWRLALVIASTHELVRDVGFDLMLTSIERTVSKTHAIYEAQDLTPPSVSVHDVRPCCGTDVVPIGAGGRSMLPELVGEWLANRINERYVYPRGKSTCIWHAIGAGGKHWHLQVPTWGDLVIRPNPNLAFTTEA